MDNNNNQYTQTGRRRRSRRRLSHLRPVFPNRRPPLLQNPLTPQSLNPRSSIPNFQAFGENWRALPENWSSPSEYWSPPTYWSPPSEYWRQPPSQYWPPPFQNWPSPSERWTPVTDIWHHAVGNWPPQTEDRRSLLSSNGGQSLLTVLNRRNNRAENALTNTVSASGTEGVQTEDASDADVEYLYSVDISSEGHFAEEVDLTADSTISSTWPEPSPSQPVSAKPQPEKCNKTRKRKLSDSEVNTEKRHRQNLSQPCCSFCLAHYDELRKRNQFLCVARCGHTFCRPCTSAKGTKKACNICKTLIGSLYKIFL